MILKSPHPFPERHLLYGPAGSGKTNAVLSIAKYTDARFWVVESDYSAAWTRAVALEYPEVAERVEVRSVSDWPSFINAVRWATASAGDSDWVAVDSSSQSYSWVQDWTLEQCYGDDLTAILINARREAADAKAYKGVKLELMQWDLVKKEYAKFWREVQGYAGHLALTAEAKEIGYWQRDDATVKQMYGTLGLFPVGQQPTIHHAMSTTLLLSNPRAGDYRMTTVKDRNRTVMDQEQVGEFAMDYLVGTAGWERVR